MKVGEVMTRGVEFVSASATVQEAATAMAEHDIGAVLVASDKALEGILTDRDIILRLVVSGGDAGATKVASVMSGEIFACRPDDNVEQAFEQMSERQVRRLPVLDEAGTVVGIVTRGDLARRERDPEKVGEVLRDIAEPHRRRAVGED